MNNNEFIVKLRLSTLDCNTSTKYYQLTSDIPQKQKTKIKQYFKYYTPEKFSNLENVAGKTKGWMCKSDDVETVEKILGIKTRKKQDNTYESVQQKSTEPIHNLQHNLKLEL